MKTPPFRYLNPVGVENIRAYVIFYIYLIIYLYFEKLISIIF